MLSWDVGVVLPAKEWVDKELFVVPYLTARKAEEEILLVGKDFLSEHTFRLTESYRNMWNAYYQSERILV